MKLCHVLQPLWLVERRSSHSLWYLPVAFLSLALTVVRTMREGNSPPMAQARKAPRHWSTRGWVVCAHRCVTCLGCPTGWVVALVLLLMSYTAAAQVILVWDASVSMVDGYWLYYGPTSGSYTARIDVGTATTYTITGLTGDQTYYFVVTAYDRTGSVESPFSNEVGITLPSTQPLPAEGGTETMPDADSDGVQSRSTQLAGGGGGCTLNPGAECDPLMLGMSGLCGLWLTTRAWIREKCLDDAP